eukprot:8063835-Pyramimonas_sp.AAC.1
MQIHPGERPDFAQVPLRRLDARWHGGGRRSPERGGRADLSWGQRGSTRGRRAARCPLGVRAVGCAPPEPRRLRRGAGHLEIFHGV